MKIYTEVVYELCLILRPEKTCNVQYVQRTTEARSWNHCGHRKAISFIYSEGVFVALVMQHAKGMRHILLSSVACLASPLSTLSKKNDKIFGKGFEHKM
jgi:hypothetical protein